MKPKFGEYFQYITAVKTLTRSHLFSKGNGKQRENNGKSSLIRTRSSIQSQRSTELLQLRETIEGYALYRAAEQHILQIKRDLPPLSVVGDR